MGSEHERGQGEVREQTNPAVAPGFADYRVISNTESRAELTTDMNREAPSTIR